MRTQFILLMWRAVVPRRAICVIEITFLKRERRVKLRSLSELTGEELSVLARPSRSTRIHSAFLSHRAEKKPGILQVRTVRAAIHHLNDLIWLQPMRSQRLERSYNCSRWKSGRSVICFMTSMTNRKCPIKTIGPKHWFRNQHFVFCFLISSLRKISSFFFNSCLIHFRST